MDFDLDTVNFFSSMSQLSTLKSRDFSSYSEALSSVFPLHCPSVPSLILSERVEEGVAALSTTSAPNRQRAKTVTTLTWSLSVSPASSTGTEASSLSLDPLAIIWTSGKFVIYAARKENADFSNESGKRGVGLPVAAREFRFSTYP